MDSITMKRRTPESKLFRRFVKGGNTMFALPIFIFHVLFAGFPLRMKCAKIEPIVSSFRNK